MKNFIKKSTSKIKVVGVMTLVALGALTMTACSKAEKQARDNLNVNMKDKINQQLDSKNALSFEVDKYEFLGADFKESGSFYTVDLNGVARNKEKDKNAYINAGLKIEKSKASEIKNKQELSEVLNFLATIVKDYKFEYLEFLPVDNVKELSDAVTKSLESPTDGFYHSSGMLYAVSKPIINKEEGFAVFQTKSYVKYYKTTNQVTYGVTGFDSNGSPEFGTIIRTNTEYEYYLQTNNVYVRANEKELNDIENNPKVAYDKFITAYQEKDKAKYIVQSVEVEKSQEFNTNMQSYASLNLTK